MPRQILTDDQVWIILNAQGATDAQLANALGANASTVHHRRWLLRRHGWTCSVRYALCPRCSETVTLRGDTRSHAFHQACRVEVIREGKQRHDAERPLRPDALARAHQWSRDAQERSLLGATNHGSPWTDNDDAYLVAHWNDGLVSLADDMGRTVTAVRDRRFVLRRREEQKQENARHGDNH